MKAIYHILQALKDCPDQVKPFLLKALEIVEKKEKKISNVELASKQFAEEAKKKNERWQKMLKDSLKPRNIDD